MEVCEIILDYQRPTISNQRQISDEMCTSNLSNQPLTSTQETINILIGAGDSLMAMNNFIQYNPDSAKVRYQRTKKSIMDKGITEVNDIMILLVACEARDFGLIKFLNIRKLDMNCISDLINKAEEKLDFEMASMLYYFSNR